MCIRDSAITEAVGLVLQALPPETARQVLNSYYGPSGIGYSLVRTLSLIHI